MKKFRMSEERFNDLCESYTGLCLSCGAGRSHCEPDARGYPCEECGEPKVYGAEELLLMGRIEVCCG